ncbi:Long chain base biosynthesis protein 1b [Camellia lanceoleosa]|uniref:Long chain base biosynthesis protein 1b n=1 Tax=Camellia lanceoleosa TaxID=1840588 RepID=A0ACC0FR09_9ERIC|nr:Long chain base biosynthesis protein 1b [Camellia lanceoleosa]
MKGDRAFGAYVVPVPRSSGIERDLVFVVTSKRSTLDKCCIPVRIRLFISAAHSESDLRKAFESLKRVAAAVLAAHD